MPIQLYVGIYKVMRGVLFVICLSAVLMQVGLDGRDEEIV
jgi:hypothetical protein